MFRRIGTAVVVGAIAAAALAAPATAVTGVVRELGELTDDSIVAVKTATATCPASAPRIVGVGARIEDDETGRVFLRRLQPIKNAGRDVASVTSAAPTGVVTSYRLRAIAVCAPSGSVPGHEVVRSAITGPSSATAQDTAKACSAGKKVVGYGGEVVDGGRDVGLQVVRSDKPRGISRAYARELPLGFDGQWGVQAVAICYTTSSTETPVQAAQSGLTGDVLCSTTPDTRVHGAGGGAWDGTGMIRRFEPSADLRRAEIEVTPGSTATLVSVLCLR